MQHSWIPTETSDLVVYDHIHLHAEKNYSIGFKNGEYGASPPFSKNGSDGAVDNLHIYAPKLDWLNG